jgi:hypothetical protein
MKEYSINLRKDGSAVISKNGFNPDATEQTDIDFEGNEISSKPYLYEVGMKVVDIFNNIVTIKDIMKFQPTSPGSIPHWNITVEENDNGYWANELAGIYVRELTPEQLKLCVG